MSNLRKRFLLDFALTVMIVIEMFYQFTGNTIHEILGLVFAITIVVHVVLSRKWFSATGRQIAKGRAVKAANKLRIVLVIGLAISFIALMVSSIVISELLLAATQIDLAGRGYANWVVVHGIASYALCGFTLMHLLVHWASAASAFKIPYNPSRRTAINTGMGILAAAGVALIATSGIDPISKALARQAAIESADNASSDSQEEGTPKLDADDVKAEGDAPSDTSASPNQPDGNAPHPDAPQEGGKPLRDGTGKGQGKGKGKLDGAPHDPNGSDGTRNEYPENGGGTSQNDGVGNGGISQNTESERGDAQTPSTSQDAPSGYCTLCRLHCPLSAPACDRPYLEGLL